MTIEFTDRYGGRPPSWLRGCFGPCEAMGWVPVFYRDPRSPHAGTAEPGQIEPVEVESDPQLLALWHAAEEQAPAADGWHFVRCPTCRGTGRVPWWRTLGRVPRWLYRGVRFVWSMGVVRNKECRPEQWTWRRAFVTCLKVAFLADLGLWHP